MPWSDRRGKLVVRSLLHNLTMSEYKYSTLAVHAGQYPDPQTGAVNVPIYLSSTFELDGIGANKAGTTRAAGTLRGTGWKRR